jgi:predicted ester cyclase
MAQTQPHTFASQHPLVPDLVLAGELEVSPERFEEARAMFSDDFAFHGPGGLEADYEGLAAYFASLREAFPDLAIFRIIAFGEGSYLASRTGFRGTFSKTFTMAPAGPTEPNGKVIEWEVMNIFRYDDEGKLAEEWVRSDGDALQQQLNAR